MKKFSIGIIVVLFLVFVFVVGAQNTIKPPTKVTPVSESKPDLRIPTLRQIPPITPQPETGAGLQVPSLEKPSAISSSPEQKPTLIIPQLQGVPPFAPQPEQRPTLTVPQLQGISPLTPQPEFTPEPQLFALRELPPIQGLRDTEYGYLKLSDFSGGLNKQGFPTEIADNELTELVNFVWEGKKLVPRDGFTTYYDMSEFATSRRIWGLYRYYKRDGSKITLAGVNDSLFADTNSSGNFHVIKTGVYANSKYYYFDTFKDKAIVAHEGDYPFWYDGDSTQNLGLIATGKMLKAKSSTACSAGGDWTTEAWFTISPNASVEDDDLVAYTVGFTCGSIAGGWMYEFITKYRHGIGEDTVFIPSVAVCWPDTTKTFKIMVNFSKGVPVDSGVIDSSDLVRPGAVPNCGYWFKVFDFDKSWSSDQYVRYIIEAKDREKYESYTRYIQGNADNRLYLGYYTTEEADTSLFPFQEGMEYRIRKLDFHIARLVEVYKNRIFLVAREQDPELKERIIFSKFNNLNDFPPDNYIPLNFKQNEYVTALATFYEDQLGYKDQSKDCLVIFTNNSIYKLIFNSTTDKYLVQVVEGIGCVAPKTVVNVEGKYLLFLHTTGVYAFDGRTVTRVSDKLGPIVETFNNASINRASAGYYDHHYYLSYPDSGFGLCSKTLVFNTDLGGWAKVFDMRGSVYCQQNALTDTCKLLFAEAGDKSLIYRFGITETDTGQPISLTLKSKAFNLGDLHKRKRFTYFDLDYYLDSDSVGAWFYTDFGDSLRYSTYFNESGGNRHVRIPLDADCLGRNFSFKLTSNKWFELGSVAFKFRQIGE